MRLSHRFSTLLVTLALGSVLASSATSRNPVDPLDAMKAIGNARESAISAKVAYRFARA